MCDENDAANITNCISEISSMPSSPTMSSFLLVPSKSYLPEEPEIDDSDNDVAVIIFIVSFVAVGLSIILFIGIVSTIIIYRKKKKPSKHTVTNTTPLGINPSAIVISNPLFVPKSRRENERLPNRNVVMNPIFEEQDSESVSEVEAESDSISYADVIDQNFISKSEDFEPLYDRAKSEQNFQPHDHHTASDNDSFHLDDFTLY
ncbi:PREDICTED: uncharacterized protein LOC109588795 [Amphimedon queenslandica]|nr:PREDICTED: uncharacterized protein LOC109588795 [Amphimedon queenslandica]|eukprot:XP_019860465.1 PREDICTED: uncharacterized protein LOC109588795 [Amphimedon queenslandica]